MTHARSRFAQNSPLSILMSINSGIQTFLYNLIERDQFFCFWGFKNCNFKIKVPSNVRNYYNS